MSQVGEELNELSDNLIQAQLEKKEECEWESEEWDKSEEEWESSDKEWEESDKEWEESDKEWEESDKEWEQSDKECEELEEEGMMEHEQFCEEEEDLGKEYWKENFDESDASEDLDCERSTSKGKSKKKTFLNLYITKGGCCGKNCLAKDTELSWKRAHALHALDTKTKKAVILGMLAMIRDDSSCNRQGEQRVRNTFRYRLSWSHPICRDAFCAVAGIGIKCLKLWQSQVGSESDVKCVEHGNTGRSPHHALSHDDTCKVVHFIKQYANTNGLPDPGRLKGKHRNIILDSSNSMQTVYNEYRRALTSTLSPSPPLRPSHYLTLGLKRQYSLLNDPPTPPPPRPPVEYVCYNTFAALWHKHCPDITQQASRSDLCDTCDKILVTLRHSMSDEQRKKLNQTYNKHRDSAKLLRDHYIDNIATAEREWRMLSQRDRDQVLQSFTSPRPLTTPMLDIQMQYSFDYCQQVAIPYSSQQRGHYFFRTPRKVQVFGVCCEPLKRQVFFLIDEAEKIGKGAMSVVSQVHAFLKLHSVGEKCVTLQADNCVGQNKNSTMLWYLAWRVITGQHDRVELNFMLPGHTKFVPDSYFGIFKKHYRQQDHVDDMSDLVECVKKCGCNVTCVPQQYQNWVYYNWNAFLDQWFVRPAGFSMYHTFIFDKEHPGIVKMKLWPDQVPRDMSLLKDGVTVSSIQYAYRDGTMPRVVLPKGLTQQRAQYLYDNVSEFVHDKSKVINVCPNPQAIPMESADDANKASTHLEEDQPGPSSTFLPVVNSEHEDLICIDSEDGQKPGRIRRCRAELNLVYVCPLCEKKYASNQALYLHKRNKHNIPHSKNEGGVKEESETSCQEKVSQPPSGNKKRKRSEIELLFSCKACGNKYGSQSALYTHTKIKHPPPKQAK
ncbi:hypothetical protein EMCRGX_G020665 [Ephydatia muelleri]